MQNLSIPFLANLIAYHTTGAEIFVPHALKSALEIPLAEIQAMHAAKVSERTALDEARYEAAKAELTKAGVSETTASVYGGLANVLAGRGLGT